MAKSRESGEWWFGQIQGVEYVKYAICLYVEGS